MKIKIKCPNADKWKKQNMDFTDVSNDISLNITDVIILILKMAILIILSKKPLSIILKVMDFRRIERLIGISHVSIINWVKQLLLNLRILLRDVRIRYNIIKLDEMWVISKNIATAVNRKIKKLIEFNVVIEILKILRIFVITLLTLTLGFMHG